VRRQAKSKPERRSRSAGSRAHQRLADRSVPVALQQVPTRTWTKTSGGCSAARAWAHGVQQLTADHAAATATLVQAAALYRELKLTTISSRDTVPPIQSSVSLRAGTLVPFAICWYQAALRGQSGRSQGGSPSSGPF
jgi:hypothetical protein